MEATLSRVAAILAIGLCSCARWTSDPQPSRMGIAEIQEASDSLESAYVRGDADAVADLLTEHVTVSPIGLADLEGQETIRSFFAAAFRGMKVTRYSFHVREAEVYGDVAYDRGVFEWESVSEGQPVTRSSGRYHAVRHRGLDGMWRLHRLIENQWPPAS